MPDLRRVPFGRTMSLESPVQKRGWIALARLGVLVWRLNTGKAWVASGKPIRLTDGSVKLPGGRPISLGFGLIDNSPVVGAGDLIGGTKVRITQAMVGRDVLVFSSFEAKRTDGGRRSPDQIRWAGIIADAGGISGFFSSPEEAEAIVTTWRRNIGAD